MIIDRNDINSDYYDDYDHVRPNRKLFRWTVQEIPYEFDQQAPFEEPFNSTVVAAIEYLNQNRYLVEQFGKNAKIRSEDLTDTKILPLWEDLVLKNH